MTAKTIIDSIVKTLTSDTTLGSLLTIYDGYVVQNLSKPCIVVTEYRSEDKEQTHGFQMCQTIFQLEIHCKDKTDSTATSEETDIYSFARTIYDKIKELLFPTFELYKLNTAGTDMIKTGQFVRCFNFNGHPANGNYYIYLTYKGRIVKEDNTPMLNTIESETHIR